jgi:hypothetical protein
MRICILFCMLLLIKAVAFGQTTKVEFAYDAAGNRTSRQIVTIPAKSAFLNDTIAISEEKMGEKTFKLYPNPTNGVLTMGISHLDAGESVKIMITDMTGRTILKEVQNNPNFKIDLSSSPKGFYLLTVLIGDQRKEWKIIKE